MSRHLALITSFALCCVYLLLWLGIHICLDGHKQILQLPAEQGAHPSPFPQSTPHYRLEIELTSKGELYVNSEMKSLEEFITVAAKHRDHHVLLIFHSDASYAPAREILTALEKAGCTVTFSLRSNPNR